MMIICSRGEIGGSKANKICKNSLSFYVSCRLVTMLLLFLILPIFSLSFIEATNETAVVKYHPKQNGAPGSVKLFPNNVLMV
jgi:hypothetical protein